MGIALPLLVFFIVIGIGSQEISNEKEIYNFMIIARYSYFVFIIIGLVFSLIFIKKHYDTPIIPERVDSRYNQINYNKNIDKERKYYTNLNINYNKYDKNRKEESIIKNKVINLDVNNNIIKNKDDFNNNNLEEKNISNKSNTIIDIDKKTKYRKLKRKLNNKI